MVMALLPLLTPLVLVTLPAATFEFDPASARLAAPRRDRASRVARASPRAPRRVRVRVRIVVGVARARLTRAAVRPRRRRTVDSLPENLWI